MSTQRKEMPKKKFDARYRSPIDELRAMAWHFSVKQSCENASNNQLAKKFNGRKARWVAYENGSQPNEQLLDQVDSMIRGSKEVYLCGPNGLKLWNALVSNDKDILNLILEMSNGLDSKLVRFRISILFKWVNSDYGDTNLSEDWYDSKINYFKVEFSKLLGELLAEKTIDILEKELRQYLDEIFSETEFNSTLNEDISAHNQLIYESIRLGFFEQIQMKTIKDQGARPFI